MFDEKEIILRLQDNIKRTNTKKNSKKNLTI